MNPRNIGAPGKETSIVDDFPVEEHILDSPIEPLEMFPPESRKTRAAQQTAVLDLGEFPLRRSPGRVTTVPRAPVKPRRSGIRFVSKAAVVVASIVAALIAGAAVRNRLDLSAVSDQLAVAVSNYLPTVQTVKPAPPDVSRPPVEAAPHSATTASTTGTAESRPAPVAAAKSVTVAKKPSLPAPRPPASSARSSRTAAAPTRPPSRPFIQRGAESLAAGRAVAETPVPAVNSPPRVAAVGSQLPVPAVSSAPQVAAASSAPAVPAPIPAPAVSAPTPAPPPPSPVTAPSATPAGGLTAETRAVAVVLNRYQAAFSSLDANAAHAVWPSVDVRALAKAFDQLEEQTFDLEGCNITVAGAQAEADCAGNARYITKVGNRALRVQPRRWHFKLRQTNDQWLIDAVDAR
jgi:hypothetical protein